MTWQDKFKDLAQLEQQKRLETEKRLLEKENKERHLFDSCAPKVENVCKAFAKAVAWKCKVNVNRPKLNISLSSETSMHEVQITLDSSPDPAMFDPKDPPEAKQPYLLFSGSPKSEYILLEEFMENKLADLLRASFLVYLTTV
jgi:hypothetical protein